MRSLSKAQIHHHHHPSRVVYCYAFGLDRGEKQICTVDYCIGYIYYGIVICKEHSKYCICKDGTKERSSQVSYSYRRKCPVLHGDYCM
jgi:hypothetical protein